MPNFSIKKTRNYHFNSITSYFKTPALFNHKKRLLEKPTNVHVAQSLPFLKSASKNHLSNKHSKSTASKKRSKAQQKRER